MSQEGTPTPNAVCVKALFRTYPNDDDDGDNDDDDGWIHRRPHGCVNEGMHGWMDE